MSAKAFVFRWHHHGIISSQLTSQWHYQSDAPKTIDKKLWVFTLHSCASLLGASMNVNMITGLKFIACGILIQT